ncbi:hypothetical protein BH09PAT2_BH09PAT2_05620 [soil metagenome]
MAFSLPFLKKKPEKHVYFGLYYTESRINGFAFDLDGTKANILSQTGYDISAGYEKMLEDIDSLISDLEQKTHLSLDKTIFFLHSTMLDDETHDIKEPYKETLKKISKELELEPMGYIDLHEAIEGSLKESSVINSVLVELSASQLAVFIYKGGLIAGKQTISRTDSAAADLDSALKALPERIILPSKIILYGVGDLTKASADIAQYKWDEKVFVQHPIIDILTDIPLYQILADTFVEELISQDGVKPTEKQSSSPSTAVPIAVATTTSMPFGFSAGGTSQQFTSSTPGLSNISGLPSATIAASEPVILSPEPKSSWMSGVAERFSARPSHQAGRSVKIVMTIVAIIITLAAIFVGYEYFLHTVVVEVKLSTTELSKKFDLSLPISDSASADELSLIKHSKVIEYDDEKSTTGKRDVGEKAKGDIILHNFDNSEKTVERGTELKAGNLIFILDSDAKIASSSGISSDGIKQSGKQKASVTAKDIGSDYNISKGTQMKVGSLSDSLFIGIVDAAFTGGSKKQVTTVSKTDMDALKKTVEEEIKKQAKAEVQKLIAAEDDIIPELTAVEITDTTYSGEVGEEAKNISIKASSEINYYTIDKKKLQKKLYELLSKEKDSTFSISENDITYKVDEAEIGKSGDNVAITLDASTKQFKGVDLEKIKSDVTFKPISKVETQIKAAYEVAGATVSASGRKLPFTAPWLPLFKKNITVKTSIN